MAQSENTRGLVPVPLSLLQARVPFDWEDLVVVEVTIPPGLRDDDLGRGTGSGAAHVSHKAQ